MEAVKRKKAAEATKRWRKRNPEKVREANRRARSKDGYAEYHRNYNRAWAARNKDSVKNTDLKKRYRIGLSEYSQLLEAQNGSCGICNKAPDKKMLAVDHCHATGIIRGLLCDTCNRAIGLLQDNVEVLRKAISYLESR